MGGDRIAILNRVVRESITEKTTSEQRYEGGVRGRHAGNKGRT